MLSSEAQLGFTLQAFAYAHELDAAWPAKFLGYFTEAGITSMLDLTTGCADETLNMDLEFIGCTEKVSPELQLFLHSFLPGPVGLRCFRVAQRAAVLVDEGKANTTYVHRPENGKKGDELFHAKGNDWTLHVDCAGFVRSVLKHVTKSFFQVSLSDRSFMRAKDFYRFFETVELTVLDKEEICTNKTLMKWRVVPDLRMVIPGDIIVWRPKGSAAGRCAFTSNDRKDLRHLLKAVKMARLWKIETEKSPTGLVTRHVGQDPIVKEYIRDMQKQFNAVGIFSCTQFRAKFDNLNDLLVEKGFEPIDKETLLVMKECAETTALNTGHIVFASGPAQDMGNNEYRFPVVHSTKAGKTDKDGNVTEGVQEYFRRFQLVQGPKGLYWTRQMKKDPLPEILKSGDSDDDADVDEDDPEDKDDAEPSEHNEEEDELAGLAGVEVIAARMCF